MSVTISFLGAAEGVTGSRHLLEVDGKRILVDCGLFQGRRDWAREHNERFPIDPSTVHNVVLTHGHIDHSGALPILVRDGFRGHIYCTSATADLTRILLRDSGHIQVKDAEHLNRRAAKHARREHTKAPADIEPLYTIEDAERCDPYFHTIPYHESETIAPGVTVRLTDQGHIIGSSAAEVTIARPDGPFRIVFSGDRGRPDMPILRDPEPYPACDVVLTESTYGNRVHETLEIMEDELERIVKGMIRRRGRLLIPAFSVGRTQNILYHLHHLILDKRLPRVEIFVDSPLSTKATRVYAEHPECFDEETLEFLEQRVNPFQFEGLRYVESVDESKTLNDHPGPCIIFSASGMCESGRILHHLKRSAENERDTILIVGWMAPHTLGRRLVEKQDKIKIYGRTYRLKARVERLNGLSAHADAPGLVSSLEPLKGRVKTVFLIHGDHEQADPLRDRLTSDGFGDVRVAELGSTVDLI